MTATQKKTAEAIINIFETSSVLGDYSKVTLIAGDTGHLTYGRSQTTLGSGNLHKLIQEYCNNPGARFGSALSPFLPRFAAKDFGLDQELHLHNILRASADDPVMRETQDLFFDHAYWKPAERFAMQLGVSTPLGMAVIYDSMVHGSLRLIRDRTNQQSGLLSSLGEKDWIVAFINTRHHWLSTHPRSDLRPTVYRMDAFRRLIDLGVWGLELPLVVRGHEISLFTLNARPIGCYDGPQPGTRMLALQSPLLRGLDVRLLQVGLSGKGFRIQADGVFGNASLGIIRAYQIANNLPANGVADIALIAQLVG